MVDLEQTQNELISGMEWSNYCYGNSVIIYSLTNPNIACMYKVHNMRLITVSCNLKGLRGRSSLEDL